MMSTKLLCNIFNKYTIHFVQKNSQRTFLCELAQSMMNKAWINKEKPCLYMHIVFLLGCCHRAPLEKRLWYQ